MGFALVGLYLKGALVAGSFASFRKWLDLGWAVAEGPATSQMSKLQNIQKIKRHDLYEWTEETSKVE